METYYDDEGGALDQRVRRGGRVYQQGQKVVYEPKRVKGKPLAEVLVEQSTAEEKRVAKKLGELVERQARGGLNDAGVEVELEL
jgi:hypothetical protein